MQFHPYMAPAVHLVDIREGAGSLVEPADGVLVVEKDAVDGLEAPQPEDRDILAVVDGNFGLHVWMNRSLLEGRHAEADVHAAMLAVGHAVSQQQNISQKPLFKSQMHEAKSVL